MHLGDAAVPSNITERLEFRSEQGETRLKFVSPGVLDQQTLRGVRELTATSAAELDTLILVRDGLGFLRIDVALATQVSNDIEALKSEESGLEGALVTRLVNTYERGPRLRAAAILLHGTACQVCGFSFGATYGPHGEGFIEVHHLRPLSQEQREMAVNPQTDLTVLCANCHRMIHRHPDQPLSLDELRRLLQGRRG